MSVSGLCEICHRPDVEHTCNRCGKLVCDEHFVESLGVCTDCASEVRGPDETIPDEEDYPDGVDTHQV
jgi:hypothetical protein